MISIVNNFLRFILSQIDNIRKHTVIISAPDALRALLVRRSFSVMTISTGKVALVHIATTSFDLVITDMTGPKIRPAGTCPRIEFAENFFDRKRTKAIRRKVYVFWR